METINKRREIKYPYIEGADEKLNALCLEGLNEKYSGKTKERAEESLAEELDIICQQGSASGYLTVLEALNAAGFAPDDICLRGTIASALVPYITGLSNIDLLGSEPQLYPEFFYGIDGDRLPAFEMNVDIGLQQRLIKYYKEYSGKEHLKHVYDDENHILSVCFGEFDEAEITSAFSIGAFRILFIRSGKRNRAVSDFIRKEILEVCTPKTASDFVKCYGLEYSTGAWEGNAEELIKKGAISLDRVIANREDAYELLMEWGIDKKEAFEVSEKIRKGRIFRDGWAPETLKMLQNHEVSDWFIESCLKIQYLFPRAHAMVYLKNYCNIAS